MEFRNIKCCAFPFSEFLKKIVGFPVIEFGRFSFFLLKRRFVLGYGRSGKVRIALQGYDPAGARNFHSLKLKISKSILGNAPKKNRNILLNGNVEGVSSLREKIYF